MVNQPYGRQTAAVTHTDKLTVRNIFKIQDEQATFTARGIVPIAEERTPTVVSIPPFQQGNLYTFCHITEIVVGKLPHGDIRHAASRECRGISNIQSKQARFTCARTTDNNRTPSLVYINI